MLHSVTKPGTDIALFIDPRQRIGHIKLTDALAGLANLSRRHEVDTFCLGAGRQCTDKVENVGTKRLGNTQGRQFHEDINDLLFFRHSGNTIDISVSKERIAIPL